MKNVLPLYKALLGTASSESSTRLQINRICLLLGSVWLLSSLRVVAATDDYTFSTLAGKAGVVGSEDATNGASARFNEPNGVALDSAGNIYVADWFNNTIRKITPDGAVSTFAGQAGPAGYVDGNSSEARFGSPAGIVVDGADNLYVTEYRNRTVRKITPDGIVTTLAGGHSGLEDGTGTNASFVGPAGLAIDSAGYLYVADMMADTIRKITPDGVVSTLAGKGEYGPFPGGSADGAGSDARFYQPNGVAVDSAGNVYVADESNYTIRKITPDGVVSTLAGQAGSMGSTDGVGSEARFNYPQAVAVDSSGKVYVSDQGGNVIRTIASDGKVTTIAGGPQGSADGPASVARFWFIQGIAFDQRGNMYLADTFNCTIRVGVPNLVLSPLGLPESLASEGEDEDGPSATRSER